MREKKCCVNCGIANVPLYLGLDGHLHCADHAGMLRARVHRRLSTSFRQILLHTALKILAIRKYACKFLPCLQKNLLENPHIFPMNTSSDPGTTKKGGTGTWNRPEMT